MNAHKPQTPIVGQVERELLKRCKLTKKWAAISAISPSLACSFCNGFPQPPFFQCGNGHLLCGAEAERFTRCPHIACDSFLVEIHLAWLKWTAQSAYFSCPADKDCEGLIRGTTDKDGHVKNSHLEIYALDTSSLSGSIEALDEQEEEDDNDETDDEDDTEDDKFSSSLSSTPQSSPSPIVAQNKTLSRKMRALCLGRDKESDEVDSTKWSPLLKPAMKELPPARPKNWTPKVDSRDLWLHPPISPQLDQDESKWEWA